MWYGGGPFKENLRNIKNPKDDKTSGCGTLTVLQNLEKKKKT